MLWIILETGFFYLTFIYNLYALIMFNKLYHQIIFKMENFNFTDDSKFYNIRNNVKIKMKIKSKRNVLFLVCENKP